MFRYEHGLKLGCHTTGVSFAYLNLTRRFGVFTEVDTIVRIDRDLELPGDSRCSQRLIS